MNTYQKVEQAGNNLYPKITNVFQKQAINPSVTLSVKVIILATISNNVPKKINQHTGDQINLSPIIV